MKKINNKNGIELKNFILYIVDNNGHRLFATREFKNPSQFAKWFVTNVFMFSNDVNFEIALMSVEIYFTQTSISIWNKETKELIYKGE